MSKQGQYYWPMSDTPDEDHPEAVQARADLELLSIRMFAALEHGIERGRAYFGDRDLDPWLFPHIVRDGVLEQLKDGPTGYSVFRNPMSGIVLECQGYQVRLFKKSGEESEFLYPTGHSQGRKDFYNQEQMILPGMNDLMMPEIVTSKPNVAYVWELQGDSVELFIVCPDGFDGIWKPGRVRWHIDVQHPAYSMTPDSAFTGLADEDDLPLDLTETASEGGE